MTWKKLGHIFTAHDHYPWMVSHASPPFPYLLHDSVMRIYFSTRDAQNRSSVAFVDVDMRDPTTVINVADAPVLGIGEDGLFDDHGVSISQIVAHGGRHYMYYLGWNLGVTTPFRNSLGVAISEHPHGPFAKYSPAPILDRHHVDPFTVSVSWIIIENGVWRMWYGSSLSWEKDGMDIQHVIKYAESRDGLAWERHGHVCIPLLPGESGVARPCVVKEGGLYHMWYTRRIGRKVTCTIGYATSPDGMDWTRHDADVGIGVSPEGWDSEMIEYPCVFAYGGQLYMLYNGNNFGRTGFGIAVWA